MQRLQHLDIMRVGAVLAVIGIHVTAYYMPGLGAAAGLNHLFRFAVPLFVIMSGFVLFYHEMKGREGGTWQFYRQRLDRILWPYVIWTGFYIVFIYALIGYKPGLRELVLVFIRHLAYGSAQYHMYFLPIILQLYIVFPLLARWIKARPGMALGFTLLVSLGFQGVFYLASLGVYSLPSLIGSVVTLLPFPFWLFYFTLGMYIACKREWFETVVVKYRLAIILVWLASFGLMVLDSHMSGQMASILRPSVMVYAVSSCLMLYYIALGAVDIAPAAVNWIAAQSFLIYLMHPAVLCLLVWAAGNQMDHGPWSGLFGMGLLYLTTAAIVCILSWLFSFNRMTVWLGGSQRKPADPKPAPTGSR